VRFHVLHQLLHNRVPVPAGVLQAATDEHFRIPGDQIRQTGPAIGILSLRPFADRLRAADNLRAGVGFLAGDRDESALRRAGDMHGVHFLHDHRK